MWAQPFVPEDQSTTFTVDPGALIDGRLNFEFDSALSPLVSFNAGVNFLAFDGVFEDSDESYFAVGPRLGLRLYMLGTAPAGLWIGPFVDLYYVNWSDTQEDRDAFGLATGGEIGVTLILLRALVLQFGAALLFQDVAERDHFTPRFRFGLGVAF
ncbi:MAG: hypothetical protein ACOC97_02535 [Myxococcota bacterium]